MKAETLAMKSREKHWKHLVDMSWAKKLPGNVRFDTWRQVVLSRFNYCKHLAAAYSKQMFNELEAFYYRSIRKLLRINAKVKKSKFLAVVLGMAFEEYQNAALIVIRKQDPEHIIAEATFRVRTAMATVKRWTEIKTPQLLKWRLALAFPQKRPNKEESLVCLC